ncbi:uncharacterized protein LOC128388574 [Panonychus citri]|uniref:uncharacterized protein LOC128388574 n=1 Tax=Panonychus citri TaxID=50023 RepID=UPI002307B10D|nr:uncharacterized protein LOC128388574 [Panonychus citri]
MKMIPPSDQNFLFTVTIFTSFICFFQANDQYYASRPIFPLHSYRDVTMFHYEIPEEIVSARWTIWSNSTLNCDPKEVILLLRWQGYPLIPSLHNVSASKEIVIDNTEQYHLSFKTSETRTTSFTLSRPLTGHWFGTGYLKHSSNRIVQRGLQHKCKVSLSTRLSLVKLNNDEQIQQITSDSTIIHRLQDKKLFKFHIPLFTNGAKLIISGCSRTSSSPSASALISSSSSSKIDRDETDDEDLISGAGSGAGLGTSGVGANSANGNGGIRRRSGEGCPIKIYTRTLGLPSDRLYDYHIDCSANLGDDCTANGFNYTQEAWNYILLVRKPSRNDNIPVDFSISIITEQCPNNIQTSSPPPSPSPLKSQFAALLSADLSASMDSTISSSSSSSISVPSSSSSPSSEFSSPSLFPPPSVTSDPLSAINEFSELSTPLSSPSSSSSPPPPPPPKSLPGGTIAGKDKQLFAFTNNKNTINHESTSHPSSTNNRWHHRRLAKTTETVSCPFRINLIRYNLHGSFNFQFDYVDAFKTRSGHLTYSPFVDIPNAMKVPAENDNPSSSSSSSSSESLSLNDNLMSKETIIDEKRNNLLLPKSLVADSQRTYNLTELSVLHFQINPILDSGGTLTIDLGLNPLTVNMSDQNVTLSGCLRQGHYSISLETCQYPMKVNSSHNPLITLNIPYPRAGLWFISLKADCYKYDGWSFKTDPCKSNVTSIIMNIKSISCFEDQCAPHGKCNQFISGGLIFSTCICNSGWKGLDCKDGSDALDEREILINFLLLTLSNLVFVPALILAIYRHLFTEAIIYLIAMSSSILYHACDSDSLQAFCLVKLNILQYVDFYSALLAFWVTLISLSNLPIKARSFFHLIGSVFLAIGVQYDRTSLWTFVIPVSAGFIIVILTWCFFCCIKRNCFPSCQLWTLSMVPGFVMTTSGLAIYSLFETKDNYAIVHSFWHAVMASALLFLIPTMERKVTAHKKPSADEEDENFRGKATIPNTKRAHVEWRPNTSFKFLQDDIDML